MPLQPHAQKQLDEQLNMLARVFKAGFKAAVMEGFNVHNAVPDYRDFLRCVESIDIVTANYVTQEVFDNA